MRLLKHDALILSATKDPRSMHWARKLVHTNTEEILRSCCVAIAESSNGTARALSKECTSVSLRISLAFYFRAPNKKYVTNPECNEGYPDQCTAQENTCTLTLRRFFARVVLRSERVVLG
jgi:hypothetical protein